MNNPNKDRDRDAGTGRYVSDEFADQHPETTVSEEVKPQPHIWRMLTMLSTGGGAIVREQDLTADEIETAKAEGRHWGGFVYVPIQE